MKKTKLLLSLAIMCLAIAVLCFGVLAATSVTYTISGTISYEVKDAYVEITTKKYTMTTEYEKASDLRTAGEQVEAGTLSLGTGTQVGTTYNSLNETGTNENSGLALTYDLSSTTKVRTNWIVAEVKNLSDAELYVKVIDDHELDFFVMNSFIYRTQDVTSLAGKSSTKIVIGFTLWDETNQIDAESYGFKLEVGLAENYSPLKFQAAQTITTVDGKQENTKSAYYYVEMGDFYGLPVRWKLIAEKDTSDSASDGTVAGVYKYDATTKYKSISTATVAGLETYRNVDGIFLQETITGDPTNFNSGTYKWYSERGRGDGLTSCSFNGYKQFGSTYYKTNDEGEIIEDVLANDYYNSRVRQYLNSTTDETKVKQAMRYDGTARSEWEKSNFVTDLNISTVGDYVYGRITSRVSMEIKTGSFSNGVWTATTVDYASGKTDINDKFWLLSVEEMLTWVNGGKMTDKWESGAEWKHWKNYNTDDVWGGVVSWLRSGSSEETRMVVYGSDSCYESYQGYYSCMLPYGGLETPRAAFNLAL